MTEEKRTGRTKIILAALVGVLTVLGAVPLSKHRHYRIPVVAGPGVTGIIRLSELSPGLKGTLADTNVYVMEGKEPGGKALLISNTHANEPAGLLANLIVIEGAGNRLEVGMDLAADLISSGYDIPSTLPEKSAPDFRELFDSADLIISKGQGNLEGLVHRRDPRIFFLLMVKCDVIADLTGVAKGDFIVYNKNHGKD